jgi:hypothetical protein
MPDEVRRLTVHGAGIATVFTSATAWTGMVVDGCPRGSLRGGQPGP